MAFRTSACTATPSARARFSSSFQIAGGSRTDLTTAKAFLPDTIPDKAFVNEVYTHSLERLLGTAGLKAQFDTDSKADPNLAAAWGIASQWTESSRYSLWDSVATASLINAIADQTHGVFQWIKKHW